MLILSLLLQAATQHPEAQPFFTNDVPGLLKLALSLGTVAAAIIGSVWKFMRGDLKQDLNGLGTRVGATEAFGPRLVQIEQQKLADAQQFLELNRARGSMETAIQQLQETQVDGKMEIIARINDMQLRIESRINESNVLGAELRGEVRAYQSVVRSTLSGLRNANSKEEGQ